METRLWEHWPYGGYYEVPLEPNLIKLLGWKSGDKLTIEVSMTNPDQIIIHKSEKQDV